MKSRADDDRIDQILTHVKSNSERITKIEKRIEPVLGVYDDAVVIGKAAVILKRIGAALVFVVTPVAIGLTWLHEHWPAVVNWLIHGGKHNG